MPIRIGDPHLVLITIDNEHSEFYRIALVHGHEARGEHVARNLPLLGYFPVELVGYLEAISLREILWVDGRRRELIGRRRALTSTALTNIVWVVPTSA
ncbi:MAG: hypothetical protein O7C72_06645 [Deltaproteobacteria bacterium]|nr:hypothetical protein [Deltaproteobacteria bacterium]